MSSAAGSSADGSVIAIVPAAGVGVRLGPGEPKALRELAGEPILVHAVRSLLAGGEVDRLVVAAPPDAVRKVEELLAPAAGAATLVVLAGGDDRRASVAAALAALTDDTAVVLVHDAARPLVPATMVRRVIAAVRAGAPAVVPGLPVTDTIKRVAADGTVMETVDRRPLRAVQTPQGFDPAVLARAHREANRAATDDAGMAEELGIAVRVVEGDPEAFKVTHPFDLAVAEAVLRSRRGTAQP